MIGIKLDSLDSIISRVADEKDNHVSNSKKLSNIIDSLESCYNGNYVDFLFDQLIDMKDQLGDINKILSNYVDVLTDVKKSYVKQNEIFKEQISHISSII